MIRLFYFLHNNQLYDNFYNAKIDSMIESYDFLDADEILHESRIDMCSIPLVFINKTTKV